MHQAEIIIKWNYCLVYIYIYIYNIYATYGKKEEHLNRTPKLFLLLKLKKNKYKRFK